MTGSKPSLVLHRIRKKKTLWYCTEFVLRSLWYSCAVLNIGFRAVLDLPPKLLWESQIHAAGLSHGDLKPANVVMSKNVQCG